MQQTDGDDTGSSDQPKVLHYFEYSAEDRDRIISTESLFDAAMPDTDMARELTNLSKRKTRLHLHMITLSDYIRQGIIPKGLRWQKEPSLGQRTEEFSERWCAILNKCSMDLMTLLVDQLQKDTADLDKQIALKKQELKQTLKDDKKLNTILKTNKDVQEKLATEIKERKIKKFNLDKKETEAGRVYNWRIPEEQQHQQRRRFRRQTGPAGLLDPPSTSISSFSSNDFLAIGEMDRPKRGRPRKNARGGGRNARQMDYVPPRTRTRYRNLD